MRVDGARLKELRENKGLLQADVARRASVTKAYVSMLERGRRTNVSPVVAARLAQTLGVAIVDLRPTAEGR